MSHAIKFRATPALPIAESNQTFPVGRIYCVGRNYYRRLSAFIGGRFGLVRSVLIGG